MMIRMPALFAAFRLLITLLGAAAYSEPEYGARYMLVGRWKSPKRMPGAVSEVTARSTEGAAGARAGGAATGSVAGAVGSSGLQASAANTRAEQARARRRAPLGARLNG